MSDIFGLQDHLKVRATFITWQHIKLYKITDITRTSSVVPAMIMAAIFHKWKTSQL